MMVPHRAMLHSNRSCCIGNLDKALLHPLTRETIVKDHIWISKIQHVHMYVDGALWIFFSARTMLRSKGVQSQDSP